MDSIEKLIATLGQKARKASKNLRAANTEEKNAVLIHIASNIQKNKVSLITENAFKFLDAPIIRLGSLDTPVPFSKNIENDIYLPIKRIEETVNKLMSY